MYVYIMNKPRCLVFINSYTYICAQKQIALRIDAAQLYNECPSLLESYKKELRFNIPDEMNSF